MQILILPYIDDILFLQNAINKDSIDCNVANNDKKHNWSGLVSYSLENKKIIITPESGITQNDVKKESLENLGNGISSGTINNIPCTWICFAKNSKLTKENIDKILHIITQENLKLA